MKESEAKSSASEIPVRWVCQLKPWFPVKGRGDGKTGEGEGNGAGGIGRRKEEARGKNHQHTTRSPSGKFHSGYCLFAVYSLFSSRNLNSVKEKRGIEDRTDSMLPF